MIFSDFFKPLLPEIKRLKNGAQVISGVTAAVGIWAIVTPKLAAFHWMVGLAVAALLTILSIAIIEGGLRKLAPFAVRQAVWYRFQSRWWIIMYVPIVVISMALMTSTTALSWFASPEIVQASTPQPKLQAVDGIASDYDSRRAAIVSDFQKQKKAVETASKQEKQAIAAKYDGLASKKAADAKAKPEHAHWMMPQAKAFTAKRNDKVAGVASAATSQIAAINEAERQALAELSNERKAAINDARNANSSTIATVQQSVTLWGRFLAWIAAGASILFLFCVFLEEVYARGSHTEPPLSMPSKVLMGATTNRRQQEQEQKQEQPIVSNENKANSIEPAKKQMYKQYANKTRVYWKRFREQPHTETGLANKAKSEAYADSLRAMGYKVTLDTSDSTKLKIDPFNEPTI